MSVSAIMTSPPVTVEMDDSLGMVKDIFEQTRFHHLLVVDSGKLFGVISDRDLFKALSPNIGTAAEGWRDAATLNKRVHQIMSRDPVTLDADAAMHDVIDVFNTHDISCIPIVDTEGRPVGVVSWRDLLRALGSARARRSSATA